MNICHCSLHPSFVQLIYVIVHYVCHLPMKTMKRGSSPRRNMMRVLYIKQQQIIKFVTMERLYKSVFFLYGETIKVFRLSREEL